MSDFPVYLATIEMKPEILELLREMHEEVDLFPYDYDEANDHISKMLNREGGIIGVMIADGRLEATVGLRLDRLRYSKRWFLSEMFIFVRPELRKSTRAKCLLQFAKKCAEEMEIPLLLGITSNIRTEAKRKLYERQFDPMGSFFVHNKDCIGA
jgi:hypothetical protein